MATSPNGAAQTLEQAAAQTISGNNTVGNVVHMPNGAGSLDTGTADQTVASVELVAPQTVQLLEVPTMAELEARILQRIVEQFEALEVAQQAALQSAASASAAPQVAAEATQGHPTVPEHQAPDSPGDTDAQSQWSQPYHWKWNKNSAKWSDSNPRENSLSYHDRGHAEFDERKRQPNKKQEPGPEL